MISRAAIRRPGLPARQPDSHRRLAALLFAGAVFIATACGSDGPDASAVGDGPAALGLAVPVLDLDDVPANIAGHYEFAAANRDVYDAVPCYCGCEKSIGHRNLTDCFVRSDGT
ncbi:MAG TPA: PCYCGC motif-containing (lipo)protein, partial [Ilumatobacteraceae bacterium]|nr:PCYCGC motif-containing (lipo)protein [Ilumatobacteraceae bacterium]